MATKLPSADEIADDVGFDEAHLDDNMVRQPSLVAHYGRLLAEAQFDMDTAKQKLEITESKAAHQLREDANEEGKKISEAQINSTLPTVPSVVKARMTYNRAKADYEGMKHTFEALRHKKDMMVQIGVNRRTEVEGKINGLIRTEKRDESDAELRREAKQMKLVK